MDDVAVTADEPRFVAPTRRDRIGRIWAPVLVNGEGPFRLVLDTGASHSALTPRLAQMLGISLDGASSVTLRRATGTETVPMVPVRRSTCRWAAASRRPRSRSARSWFAIPR